jgi:hypothetical protein
MRSIITLMALLLAGNAWAGTARLAAPPDLCESAIAAAEFRGRLPPRMLTAIAEEESGRRDAETGTVRPWPWTINAEGAGQFFDTKAQAVAAVRILQARGVRSIDVGCLQVNLMFHPDAFASLDEAFDPDRNAAYAARFLNTLYAASHDWKQAIGDYHSETPELGEPYRIQVLARWQRPDLRPLSDPTEIAYGAFENPQRVYGAFAPVNQVYGAFAPPPRQDHELQRAAVIPPGKIPTRIIPAGTLPAGTLPAGTHPLKRLASLAVTGSR